MTGLSRGRQVDPGAAADLTLCGRVLPSAVHSSRGGLVLSFNSDGSDQGSGFRLEYTLDRE